jgi:hypothetical protein
VELPVHEVVPVEGTAVRVREDQVAVVLERRSHPVFQKGSA